MTSHRCPDAVWKPLATRQPGDVIVPDIVCVHTIVGTMYDTWRAWERDGYTGLESTFMVGGQWGTDGTHGLDGVAWQVTEANRWADANYEGSHRIISIETGDNAPQFPDGIKAWTPKQVAKITDLVTWACEQYDIPAVLVPDSRSDRRGLAYHRQGIDPWRVAGGERWSKAYGKECPGKTRIAQFTQEIVPAVRRRLTQRAQEANDMQWTDKIKLTAMDIKNGWSESTNPDTGKPFQEGDEVSIGYMLRYPTLLRKVENELGALSDQVGKLSAVVASLQAAGSAQP